ncbi:MAG: UDP-N-acetylmuramate dehydrogenase [Spirochaetes bacterium]|nr:UDP-N-acetylmuramate dehydrogenase [Spirochaetota bacterium]
MDRVRKILEKINTDGSCEIRFAEPMSEHTTFRIGGAADAWAAPRSAEGLGKLLAALKREGLPFTILGGGANVLVGDLGIRGVVVATEGLASIRTEGSSIVAEAGALVDGVCRAALESALSGLEFASALPGSVGGAVFMNARCYGREMADMLGEVTWIDRAGMPRTMIPVRGEWAYKRTPFMPGGAAGGGIIVSARFALIPGEKAAMEAEMGKLRADRVAKGHFDWPCAGSVFKNDRRFGRPTGKILDELGFRGKRIGGALVSPKHANIFVNSGGATAADMRTLIDAARNAALAAFGFDLEPEIVFLGDFRQEGFAAGNGNPES